MNIYVGNLPYSATQEELTALFGKFGQVNSVKVVTDKFSGKSRGYGFVEMADEAGGSDAIAKLNGQDFNGRELRVSAAKPREQ
jgi:RNA recognition motif-containing protein